MERTLSPTDVITGQRIRSLNHITSSSLSPKTIVKCLSALALLKDWTRNPSRHLMRSQPLILISVFRLLQLKLQILLRLAMQRRLSQSLPKFPPTLSSLRHIPLSLLQCHLVPHLKQDALPEPLIRASVLLKLQVFKRSRLYNVLLLNPWPAGLVGCNTGTGKPAVFPKRVGQVRVRCWILTHRRTPRTRAAVLRVLTGLLQ